jgi:hypothetical protein
MKIGPESRTRAGHGRGLQMPDSVSSYRKTILMSVAAAVGCGFVLAAAIAFLHGSVAGMLESGAVFGIVTAASVFGSGLVILGRARRAQAGKPDLFLELNQSRTAEAIAAEAPRLHPLRRLGTKLVLGHSFLVGDEVEVCSLEEIRATLDPQGTLEAMPFMPEMEKFCGSRARVFRCLDKIYDYGRTKRMRQLEDCVVLIGLRCHGEAHGSCQAGCLTIWKTQWIKRPGARPRVLPSASRPPLVTRDAGTGHFVCQFTQLQAASRELRPWDVRRDLRPLLAGNVTFGAFLVAVATRWFNFAQTLRGGETFPASLPGLNQSSLSEAAMDRGDTVTVRPYLEIARTLNAQNKNRGLWFDNDMLKHCGHTYRVQGRVERIIEAATGRLLEMKSPCIVLEGVECSGELQWFGPQHEYLYWREAWLEKKVTAEACEEETRVA